MLQELLSNEKLKKQANRIGLKTNPLVWHFRKLSFLSRLKINDYVRNTEYLSTDEETVIDNLNENKKKKRKNKRHNPERCLVPDGSIEMEFSEFSRNNKQQSQKKRKKTKTANYVDFADYIIDELTELPRHIAKDCQERIKAVISEFKNKSA